MNILQFALINVGALITAAGGVFLKRLSDRLDPGAPFLKLAGLALMNSNFWLGGVCFVLPILLWTYLLRHMELTRLQPQLAIVYIYTIIGSMIFLGEIPSPLRLLGAGLIIIGVVIVGQS